MLIADVPVPVRNVDETLQYMLKVRDIRSEILDELRLIALGPGASVAFMHALELIADFAPDPTGANRELEDRDAFLARVLLRPESARAIAPLSVVDAPALGALVANFVTIRAGEIVIAPPPRN